MKSRESDLEAYKWWVGQRFESARVDAQITRERIDQLEWCKRTGLGPKVEEQGDMAGAREVDFYFLKSLEWGIPFREARELIEAKMIELSREIREPSAASQSQGS